MDLNAIKSMSLSAAQQQVERDSNAGGSYDKDTTRWSLTRDKSLGGTALIRFLPNKFMTEGDMPWAKYYEHFFENPNNKKRYVEKSLYTFGEPCPVHEGTQHLWSAPEGSVQNKFASETRANEKYVANILVIQDENAPENNGKVFKWYFTKTIFAKISEAMVPANHIPGVNDPFNPFCPMTGRPFMVKSKQETLGNGRSYGGLDTSEFTGQAGPIAADDAGLQAIMEQTHSLKDYTDRSKFGQYAELKTKFDQVLGHCPILGAGAATLGEQIELEDSIASIEQNLGGDTIPNFPTTPVAPAAPEGGLQLPTAETQAVTAEPVVPAPVVPAPVAAPAVPEPAPAPVAPAPVAPAPAPAPAAPVAAPATPTDPAAYFQQNLDAVNNQG